ncbi:MAG: KH domain-containing protein [Candidatus Hodarchaeales archaeon]|jgi:ribosomal RNA assembly protein
MSFSYRIKIPRSRIGVLIGKKGETKAEIESLAGVNVQVNSDDGSIVIVSNENTIDPTYVWKARDIIKAIGRGFNADKAFYLIDDSIFLETIHLEGSKNNIKRLKSRLIGEKGKARNMIESGTDTYISIFGSQISIIGDIEEIRSAKEAIDMLIRGSKHGTVYRLLEQKRFKLKQDPRKIWKDPPPKDN